MWEIFSMLTLTKLTMFKVNDVNDVLLATLQWKQIFSFYQCRSMFRTQLKIYDETFAKLVNGQKSKTVFEKELYRRCSTRF